MSDRVTIRIEDGVADVRMNRPEKRNALDPAMFNALIEAGEALAADATVRAVVLSGEGASFCAGLDFSGFQAMAGGPREGVANVGDLEGRITHRGQQAAYVWTSLPVPVIAAVHGHALGGGCQIAVAADLRYCRPDAQFSVLEIRWGLSPDMTITAMLTHLVGLDVAKELTFTGRMVSGEEAVRLGLASKVCEDPRAEALTLAAEIAGRSPQAIRGAKRLFNMAAGLLPDNPALAAQYRAEREIIGSLIGSPNQVEAVAAFFEKRPARYTNPA